MMEALRTHQAYGLSLDAFWGFPLFDEVTSTLKVSTSPGHHVCAVQVLGERLQRMSMCIVKGKERSNK